MSLFTAVWLTPLLLASGLGLAALVSFPFVLSLLVYVAITCMYSFYLKAFVLIDVLLLGILYTLRVIAGAVAIAVTPSFWLLALSMLLFISLALIKRCAELVSLKIRGNSASRDAIIRWKIWLN